MDPKRSELLHGGSPGTDSQLQSMLDFRETEHDKPPSPVDNVEWRKLKKLLPDFESCFLSPPGGANLSKPPSPVKLEAESDMPVWRYSESALQQYCQEKGAEFHLVRVMNSNVFNYANHSVHHFNFEARLPNPGVAEPSMKLFFAEAIVRYPKPPLLTCCRPIEQMDEVTEGCIFCRDRPHGSGIIHPISDVLKVDKRLTPVDHSPYGNHREMVMCFPGIPPWQLNHGPVVQAYCDVVRSQEEKQNSAKTRLLQLSEAVLVDLKNKKGMDLKLVKGVKHCTFKGGVYTFHHLNFEAKLHHDDELSTRIYFAEAVHHGGAECLTVCCVVDPKDKVLKKSGLCARSCIIQPDLRYVDPKNVIYVDLELGQEVHSGGGYLLCLPSMYPASRGYYYVG